MYRSDDPTPFTVEAVRGAVYPAVRTAFTVGAKEHPKGTPTVGVHADVHERGWLDPLSSHRSSDCLPSFFRHVCVTVRVSVTTCRRVGGQPANWEH